MSKLTRWAITVGAVVALVVPLGAAADGDGDWRGKDPRLLRDRHRRQFAALRLALASRRALEGHHRPAVGRRPQRHRLPSGDRRPLRARERQVVYRVNVKTAIAVAEGPAFETAWPRSTARTSASTST